VGLFSFLTGKKDERATAVAELEPAATPVATADRTAEPSAPEPPAKSDWGEPAPASPFTPPEAWNTESLTAPVPAPSGEKAQLGEVDPAVTAALQGPDIEVIKSVFDPEIPVDIYELGLIYEILADHERRVLVKMTLTSPACPSAQQLPSEVRYKVKSIPGVTEAWVEIVWEPPWDKDRMSESAKLALGMF
jgi:FeS assembly SUF system protein